MGLETEMDFSGSDDDFEFFSNLLDDSNWSDTNSEEIQQAESGVIKNHKDSISSSSQSEIHQAETDRIQKLKDPVSSCSQSDVYQSETNGIQKLKDLFTSSQSDKEKSKLQNSSDSESNIFKRKNYKSKVYNGERKYDQEIFDKYNKIETVELRECLRKLQAEINAISDVLKDRASIIDSPVNIKQPKSLEESIKKLNTPKDEGASTILMDCLPIEKKVVTKKTVTLTSKSNQKVESDRASLLKLAGLDDSSDEDEDMYPNKITYSEYGREIKKRMAHNPEFQREVKIASVHPVQKPKPSDENIFMDKFSGMRILKPLLNSSQLSTMMEGKKMVRLSVIKSHIKNNEIPGDWVTIGVIVNKTDSKISKSGTAYSIWTLTDLKNCERCTRLFLFGSAHKTLWKTSSGTIVGILNANILGNRELAPGIDICLSIDTEEKVLMLGNSPDLGTCASKTKKGGRCMNIINKTVCDYCSFHVQKEYKKSSLNRADLMSTYSGHVPKKYEMKSGIPGMNCGKSIVKKGSVLTVKSVNLKSQVEGILSGNGKNDSSNLKELVRLPSVGSRNLIQHMSKSSGSTVKVSETISTKSASALLVSHSKRLKLDKVLNIPKQDPNSVRSRDKVKDRQSWIAKIQTKVDSQNGVSNETTSISQFQLSDEEFKRIVNAKSQYAQLLSEEEALQEMDYFDVLEKKEMCENKMEDITQLPVVATMCSNCKYLAFSAAPQCYEKRHKLSKVKTFKRFFSCFDCKNSIISLYRYPIQPCTKCGSSKWKKSSMSKEKKGPKLGSEILSIRGNEIKFLTSMNDKDSFIEL